MKLNTIRLWLALTILAPTFGNAQGYIPMTTTYKTPYGPATVTNYVYTGPANYGYGIGSYSVPLTYKYVYKITMKNDSVFKAKTRIEVDYKRHYMNINMRGNDKALVPAETKLIERIDPYEGYQGLPTDSCWLFKIQNGAINSYSFIPENEMKHVIAIQQGDDAPIVKLTKENLLPMMAVQDPKVMKLIGEGKLWKALRKYNELMLKSSKVHD